MRTDCSRSFIRIAAAVFLPGLLLFTLAGCHTPNPGTPGTLGLPPENQARIVSRSLERSANKLHWKWSLIGERNWAVANDQGGKLSLERTVPLNDPEMKGATNVWEADLTVAASGNQLRWETRLHGSNGMTAKENGTQTGDLSTVKIVFDKDDLVKLPADITLAQVGAQEIKWHLAH